MLKNYRAWMELNNKTALLNRFSNRDLGERMVTVVRSEYMRQNSTTPFDVIMEDVQGLDLGTGESLQYAYYEAVGLEHVANSVSLMNELGLLQNNFRQLDNTTLIQDHFQKEINRLLNENTPIDPILLGALSYSDSTTKSVRKLYLREFFDKAEDFTAFASALEEVRKNVKGEVQEKQELADATESTQKLLEGLEKELEKNYLFPLVALHKTKINDESLSHLGEAGKSVTDYRQLRAEYKQLRDQSEAAVKQGLENNQGYQDLLTKEDTNQEKIDELQLQHQKQLEKIAVLNKEIETAQSEYQRCETQIRKTAQQNFDINQMYKQTQEYKRLLDNSVKLESNLEELQKEEKEIVNSISQYQKENDDLARIKTQFREENNKKFKNHDKRQEMKQKLNALKTQSVKVQGHQLVTFLECRPRFHHLSATCANILAQNEDLHKAQRRMEMLQQESEKNTQKLTLYVEPLKNLNLAKDINCFSLYEDNLTVQLDLKPFITPEKLFDLTKEYSLTRLYQQSTEMTRKMIAVGSQKKKNLGLHVDEIKLDENDEQKVADFHETVWKALERTHLTNASQEISEESLARKGFNKARFSSAFMLEEIQKRMTGSAPKDSKADSYSKEDEAINEYADLPYDDSVED